ncbi:MAG: metal ABC transporter substrate-binding protein [candidate division KSB1 bacterium]|nr:metal ABC transporter substrate-binding protein [candidate division KSB1 bacterium]
MRIGLSVLLVACLIGSAGAQQISYVTTIQPFRAILQEVVGSRARVHALLPPGASPHTHHLRPSDVRAAQEATALFIGGRGLDDWASELPCPRRVVFLGLLPQDSLLHMNNKHRTKQGEHQHAHGDVDPHFWTDPLAVRALLPALVDSLCAFDPAGCILYRTAAARFAARLDSLTEAIALTLDKARGSRVLLAHPFFNYFLRRFGIEVVGTVEVAAGSEPSARVLQRLSREATASGARALFTHPQLPDRAARVVAESAGIPLHQLDPIGGSEGRFTYEELLWYNTRILARVLR